MRIFWRCSLSSKTGDEAEARRATRGAHPPLSSVDLRWRFRCYDRRRYRRGSIVFTLKRPDFDAASQDAAVGYEGLAVLQLSEVQDALSRRQSCPWAKDRRGQRKVSPLW